MISRQRRASLDESEMCGRFTLTSNLDELQGRFGFLSDYTVIEPRYNIAPSQQVLAVTNDGRRRGEFMRWGLVPFWAKDAKIGYKMINAQAETASAKPAFRAAFKQRRCLVLANGFFEWRKEGKKRTPVYILLKSGEPMAFAGLWETWRDRDGEDPESAVIRSCTILTTASNSLIAPVHDRMPVILSPETEALWLDPMTEDADSLSPLLVPCPPEDLKCYEVSSAVNSAKNEGPECIEPAPESALSQEHPDERRLLLD